jgi:hypothetical protein
MKLQHWSVRIRPWGQLESPEREGSCLYALVTGHPLHHDGKEVITSPLIARRTNCVVTRSGSEYELGEPDPAYEALFPNALQRLLARLTFLPTREEQRSFVAA